MPRATLFDPANSLVTWDEAQNLADLTGLKEVELATFKPERHALHHVLIRVTAETHVPDGPQYADLGINLRSMAADVLKTGVLPHMPAITEQLKAFLDDARALAMRELDLVVRGPVVEDNPQGFLAKLFGTKAETPPVKSREERALEACRDWDKKASALAGGDNAPVYRALSRVVGSVLGQRGALTLPQDVLADTIVKLVSNSAGSDLIGRLIDPIFRDTSEKLGHRRLPLQSEPVILNAKGASASGKSSIRNKQRQIAENIGIDWQDFAIISPDYWRKILIDYNGLGDDYKYAAMLTGQELAIIDHKLDRLMADKAAREGVPHMLVDRFRFDSFETGKTGASESKLLTRFGARVYMFFLVTPPEETVTRAWQRGIETGRYKAADDLLFHNIEAYEGMPDLFLSWALSGDRWVHYEFLDNAVPKGAAPRSIAFGKNGHLVIADLGKFCDIVRYSKVNVDAEQPEDVLAERLSPEDAMAFTRRLFGELPKVDVLRTGSNEIVATSKNGVLRVNAERLGEDIPASAFGPFEQMSGGKFLSDDGFETIGENIRETG